MSGIDDRSKIGRKMNSRLSPAQFERLAQQVMEKHLGISLGRGSIPGVPKEFDLVSRDGSIVGDAKYFTMVGGERLPPAKFSIIAEHVWLLGETSASRRFLVFGNDRRVPEAWLRKYGHLVKRVEFFFLDSETGTLELLNFTG